MPLAIIELEPAYCDGCHVARACYRFVSDQFSGVTDLCGHHATKHRPALLTQGWTEYVLAALEEISS